MSGWASDFSFDYFKKILKMAKSNFELRMFSEAPFDTSGRPKIILRHDIDVSLEGAVKIAEIESDLGVQSTYLPMVESPLYSIEAGDSHEALFKIIEMGHEIGLHHNEGKVHSAKEQLEDIIGMPVSVISYHHPAQPVLNGPLMVSGMINTYAKELMDWYLSDSWGMWKEGEPIFNLSSPKRPVLQVLIHPIWWGDTHMSPADRLQDFYDEKSQGQSSQYIKKLDKDIWDYTLVKRRGLKDEHICT